MKLKEIYESQYKDSSTFNDRIQIGTQYGATSVNDTLHKKPKIIKRAKNVKK